MSNAKGYYWCAAVNSRRSPGLALLTQPASEAVGGRRPGHPRYRTVRHHRSFSDRQSTASAVAPRVGITPRLQDAELVTLAVLQRCSDSPQRRDGCATRTADCAGCSLSAHTIGLQQAPPRGDRNAARGHRASGCVHVPVHRRRVGGRLDSGRVRAIAGDDQTLRPDRVGQARRRPQPARDASRSDVHGRQNYYGRDSKPRSATPGRIVIGQSQTHRLLSAGAQAERTDSPAGLRQKNCRGPRLREWPSPRRVLRPWFVQREGVALCRATDLSD